MILAHGGLAVDHERGRQPGEFIDTGAQAQPFEPDEAQREETTASPAPT
jgi:hypothetical protein